jgi:sugar lactone lactonase YvrE
MKTITKFIYAAFAGVILTLGALTAEGAPGDLFEADYCSGTIYKFAPDGTRTTFATGVSRPDGLAFDSAGNLFAGSNCCGVIFKFAPDGAQTIFASGLAHPSGLAFDSAGNLFEAEGVNVFSGSGIINKFAPDGTRSTFTSEVTFPDGLAFDGAGNLFEADDGTDTIYKFAPDGTRSTFATGINNGPAALAFDSMGNLFVSTSFTIYRYTADGAQSIFATGLNGAVGLVFDSAGNLFEADSGTGTIYKFAPDGTRTTFATGLDCPEFLAIQPAPPTSYTAQIQQPINADGTSVFNVRRGVVPVKFTLTQNGVATCDLPAATIAATRTAGGTTGQIDESIYSGAADTGSNFRVSTCQYIYNLSASALGVGTYRVDIKINGQVVGSAVFQLK